MSIPYDIELLALIRQNKEKDYALAILQKRNLSFQKTEVGQINGLLLQCVSEEVFYFDEMESQICIARNIDELAKYQESHPDSKIIRQSYFFYKIHQFSDNPRRAKREYNVYCEYINKMGDNGILSQNGVIKSSVKQTIGSIVCAKYNSKSKKIYIEESVHEHIRWEQEEQYEKQRKIELKRLKINAQCERELRKRERKIAQQIKEKEKLKKKGKIASQLISDTLKFDKEVLSNINIVDDTRNISLSERDYCKRIYEKYKNLINNIEEKNMHNFIENYKAYVTLKEIAMPNENQTRKW